jgi:hypothetical protein
MTAQQATDRAAQLGLSAWIAQTDLIGAGSHETSTLKCVGFAELELALGEGETWEIAFTQAARLIFSAR